MDNENKNSNGHESLNMLLVYIDDRIECTTFYLQEKNNDVVLGK